jgi:lysozyme family protein
MSFDTVLPYTLQFEGGYINIKADTGGETFQGVSRRANPDWSGWDLIDVAKRQGIVKPHDIDEHFKNNQTMFNLVAALYKFKYYNPVAKLLAPERVIDKMFDCGVNAGPGAAIRFAQKILLQKADGTIGPHTQDACTGYFQIHIADDFIRKFCQVQLGFYMDLVTRKPKQRMFLPAWQRRAAFVPPH